MNHCKKLKAKVKILEIICRKYDINLDKEPLFVKFLSGKVNEIGDIPLNNNIKAFTENEKYLNL